MSPLQELKSDWLSQKQVRLFVKRDDLIEPRPSGNKWRKLKYNLQIAQQQRHQILLTFGGAFSNHILATAAAGRRFGFRTIGVIRGERPKVLNPTLTFAETAGMHLHFISRTTYRQKTNAVFLDGLHEQFGRFYMLPEGGTNVFALKGCTEIVAEIRQQLNGLKLDYCMVASGTGGTLAGIVAGMDEDGKAIGVSALKGDFLTSAVQELLEQTETTPKNWHIENNYHHGGYAKFTPELIHFMNDFKRGFGIALDPIYTGKLFYAAWDMLKKDYFPTQSTLCLIHTGGLQGIAGFNQRFGDLIL